MARKNQGSESPEEEMILEASAEAGAPRIVGQAGAVPLPHAMGGAATPGMPGGSAGSDVVIEVELRPGAAPLAASLIANPTAFLAGNAAVTGNMPSACSGLSSVLNAYNMVEARSVFTPEQIQADDQQRSLTATLAGAEAMPPEQASALARTPPLAGFVRLRFPQGTSEEEVLRALRTLPEVAQAVPVPTALPPVLGTIVRPIDDPLVGSGDNGPAPDPATGIERQWYLHRTRVPEAWRMARGSNVVIADIDWGYRTTHQDLKPNLDLNRAYNAVDGSQTVNHGNSISHGTAVLGIAGAAADGKGMAGYAPEATLWAIQANSGPSPQKHEEPWAAAIEYVRTADSVGKRKVIILEVQTGNFGNYEQVPSVNAAIRRAIASNCVVCVAAGNGDRPADISDRNELIPPTGSILVGATAYNSNGNPRAGFSNYGSRVVICAPGDSAHDVTCGSTADKAYINAFGGTSGATPKVAGTVALMLSVNPELTHDDVREILRGTGERRNEPDKPVGVFLNAAAAVREARSHRRETPVVLERTIGEEEDRPMQIQGLSRRQYKQQIPVPEFEEAIVGEALGPGVTPPTGDDTLCRFRDRTEGSLTREDRILIVEQAIELMEQFYVHRPLKEAMHAVRPVQRLRVLLRRLQQDERPVSGKEELAFHNLVTNIFISVRDLHTNYLLPRPYRDYIAYLPFAVSAFYEGDRRKYIVTSVMPHYQFANQNFGRGCQLLYWNGSPIERAVMTNADETAGSNEAARHARGVDALTIRPMSVALPPYVDWVDLVFLPPGSTEESQQNQMRQYWFVRYVPPTADGTAAAVGLSSEGLAVVEERQRKAALSGSSANVGVGALPPESGRDARASRENTALNALSSLNIERHEVAFASENIFGAEPAPAPTATPVAEAGSRLNPMIAYAALLGLDVLTDAVREAKDILFDPEKIQQIETSPPTAMADTPAAPEPTPAAPSSEIPVSPQWQLVFRAHKEMTEHGTFGYLEIRTFAVDNPDAFRAEFLRLLAQMPKEGLILDVRGNSGGHIWAAEQILQTLTPNPVQPERVLFIVTPGTLNLCRGNRYPNDIPLKDWVQSLDEAVMTGASYSSAFPITPPERCNDIGQKYYGPVVLVTDGNCYSATDIFAAGFQDHAIGKILGVDHNTGAGGANVWTHELLSMVLPAGSALRTLPMKAGMRVAIRQCLRVGPRSGALLEDLGVIPDAIHRTTREDLTQQDRDLLKTAGALLKEMKSYTIETTLGTPANGNRPVRITTRNLERLDFYLNSRPNGSVDLKVQPDRTATLNIAPPTGVELEVRGFETPDSKQCRALIKQRV